MKSLFSRYLIVTIIALILFHVQSMASNVNYYYKVTVKANSTAGGKVYVSETSQVVNGEGVVEGAQYVSNTQQQEYYNTNSIVSSSQTKDIYVYAKPESGYVLQNWTISSGSGAVILTPQQSSSTVSLTSTRSTFFGVPYGDGSMTCTIQANFVQIGMVKAESNNYNWGSATASPVNNRNGQTVTLTAIPKIALQGVKFLYWEKIVGGQDPVRIDGNATMTVVATNTVTTYRAVFSPPAETKGVYCRIKNKATNTYLTVIGANPIEQKTRQDGNNELVYFDVSSSFKMISSSEALTNPGSVIFISGEDNGNGGFSYTNLEAQTVNMRNRIMVNTSDGDIVPIDVTTLKHANGYRFSFVGGDTPYYMRADNSGNVTFDTGVDNNSLWDIQVFDRDQIDNIYFGVAPKNYFCMTRNGVTKYYTTLYTSFPYQLMDGVVAYWIEGENQVDQVGKKVTLTEIPTGETVPGRLAVVLECSSYGDAKKNRLFPIEANSSNVVQDFYLMHGDCLTKHLPSEYEELGTFYILSVKTTDPATSDMGFYTYSKEIPTNKAFVVVPKEYENLAKEVSFIWGEDIAQEGQVTTGTDGFQLVLPDKNVYYDLQGRKVEHPQKGVYIRNSRKIVIK